MNRYPVSKRPGARLHYIKRLDPNGKPRTVEDAFAYGEESMPWWGDVEFVGTSGDYYVYQRKEWS